MAIVNYCICHKYLIFVKANYSIHWSQALSLFKMYRFIASHSNFLFSFSDESVDAQTVLREMTQACFSTYNFHSVTIQMEKKADLKPGCNLCEDPKL